MEYILLLTTLPTDAYILLGLVVFLFSIYAFLNFGLKSKLKKYCRKYKLKRNSKEENIWDYVEFSPIVLRDLFFKDYPEYKNLPLDTFIENLKCLLDYVDPMDSPVEFDKGYFIVNSKNRIERSNEIIRSDSDILKDDIEFLLNKIKRKKKKLSKIKRKELKLKIKEKILDIRDLILDIRDLI